MFIAARPAIVSRLIHPKIPKVTDHRLPTASNDPHIQTAARETGKRLLADQRIIDVKPISLVTLLFFELISAFFPKPLDDIPLAQGVQETQFQFSMRDFLVESVTLYFIVTIIYLALFRLAKWFQVSNRQYIISCGFFASLLGLTLARTPIGTAFTWSAIINLHLKNGGDTGIDFTVRWLHSLFSIGVGLLSAFVLMASSFLYSKFMWSLSKKQREYRN